MFIKSFENLFLLRAVIAMQVRCDLLYRSDLLGLNINLSQGVLMHKRVNF